MLFSSGYQVTYFLAFEAYKLEMTEGFFFVKKDCDSWQLLKKILKETRAENWVKHFQAKTNSTFEIFET